MGKPECIIKIEMLVITWMPAFKVLQNLEHFSQNILRREILNIQKEVFSTIRQIREVSKKIWNIILVEVRFSTREPRGMKNHRLLLLWLLQSGIPKKIKVWYIQCSQSFFIISLAQTETNAYDLRGLWVLNVGNMQAIQSGFYLSHDKFYEIISNIFGPPTLYGLIEHKTVRKLLTVEKCGAC